MTTITKTLNTQLNQLLNQVIEQEYIDNQTMIELNRLNSFITKIIRIRNFLLEPPFTEKENQWKILSKTPFYHSEPTTSWKSKSIVMLVLLINLTVHLFVMLFYKRLDYCEHKKRIQTKILDSYNWNADEVSCVNEVNVIINDTECKTNERTRLLR